MSRFHLRRPSPGLILAAVALFVALGGGAYAATSSDKKSDTKIAKKAAKSYFNANIGGASVSHASSAGTATNADKADNAAALGGHPPSAFLLSGTSGEAWHLVGGGGPAFQNGWANYPSANGFAPAAFYVDPIGSVHLKGVVTGGTAGSTVFTLPAGYRPPENLAFAVAAGVGGPALEDVDVFSNGDVFANGSVNSAVALDGISFRVS